MLLLKAITCTLIWTLGVVGATVGLIIIIIVVFFVIKLTVCNP